MNISNSILDTIGRTPMVRINALNPNPQVNIYAKIEGFNPSGSIKDRIAREMVEVAERTGALKPGKTIIEATSGNTGIGLAMVGIVKGYHVVIVMSEGVSVERRKILKAMGAEIVLTPADAGTDGAITKAREMVEADPDRYYMPDQFANVANYMAPFLRTASEIWEQTSGQIDYLVSAIGTSGTIMGLSRFLRALNPDIKVICAYPEKGHYIQGLKNMEEAIVPAIYDPSLIDHMELIHPPEAFEPARLLMSREGIMAGMSSGAAMLAAMRTAERIKSGNIVVILPDRAEKYLSTELFEPFSR